MRKIPMFTLIATLALAALSSGCMSIKVGVCGNKDAAKAPAQSAIMSFEAESPVNEFGPSVKTTDSDIGGQCSGGAYVGYLGNGADEFVRFKKINVAKAGTYTLTIYYMSGADRQAYVSVNGGEKKMSDFASTGDFSSENMGTLELKIELKAGENTIELGNEEAYAPDIDRITLQLAK